jgi:hypothetical protein
LVAALPTLGLSLSLSMAAVIGLGATFSTVATLGSGTIMFQALSRRSEKKLSEKINQFEENLRQEHKSKK